jgi:2-amino-4-hydroxy-6-hydroxymethyldihydropteridine diphosphokinase
MTGTSSRTRSTSRPEAVVIALGSNLGNRQVNLRRALNELRSVARIVRSSPVHETEAVDSPAGSPPFLNMVVSAVTRLAPLDLMAALLDIEERLGRIRRGRNAPRTIDLDLILYSARIMRRRDLTLPHPRYLTRPFVMEPLRELDLPWHDPVSGVKLW